MHLDTLIVGAGPAGLACAIEASRLGQKNYLVIDKGCLVNSIYHFPADMVFFTTPDLLTIGDAIFVSESFRPNRIEGLNYYRAVVNHYDLKIRTYETVTTIKKDGDFFDVTTAPDTGGENRYIADKVIIATGYYDNPNRLGIPGEDLPNVSHYYSEAHPYRDRKVAVIGGKNSAVEAAMGLSRAGADVTLIHRGPQLSDSVKYWIRPDIEKLIENERIKTLFDTTVTAISPDSLAISNSVTGTTQNLANDFTFALTGYHPDVTLLQNAGVEIDDETLAPMASPETLETNVPGLYVAGSIVAGKNNNKIFIENSREHGKIILVGQNASCVEGNR